MVTLEQIRLLESKIARAIEVVNRLSEENIRLKKRNEELEEFAERLKDEKAKVEAGIASTLDRLNQFEDAIERSLAGIQPASPAPASSPPPGPRPAPAPRPVPPPAPVPPAPQPAAVPSAYTVDETGEAEDEFDETEDEAGEENGGAELDIF